MGNCWKQLKNRYRQSFRIILCGIASTGKTSILYKLKLGEAVPTTPTIAFNVENIVYKNVLFSTWDVSGAESSQALLSSYYQQHTDAFIYVVDSGNMEKIDESKENLWKLCSNTLTAPRPLLILANKQDQPNVMTTAEISERFELARLHNRNWCILPCSARTGDGLMEGMEWLYTCLARKQEGLGNTKMKKKHKSPESQQLHMLHNHDF